MATVTYKISGKNDSKGIKDAQKDLKSFGKSVQSINNILAGFTAAKIFSALFTQIKKLSAESLQLFSTSEKSLTKLNASIQKNANLTDGALKRIVKYSNQIQGVFGGEAIQDQAAFLSGLQLSEEKIKEVLLAATNLSSAGFGSLESNIKNLIKSLQGQSSEITKLIPGLDKLTKEQMRNGAVVSEINKIYEGYADNLANNTFEGKLQKFNNQLDDIKKKLGEVFANIKVETIEKIQPYLENINAWLDENLDLVTGFFVNLPTIAKKAFELIGSVMKTIFSIDFWKTYGQNVGNILIAAFKVSFETIAQLIKAIGSAIWEPLSVGLKNVAWGIETTWLKVVNAIQNAFVSVLNFLLIK
ncbi:hypothetical protein K7I13_12155 [Brucepastera parasyntrophica]|uniref:hypothetical protein n=1 Tax=Brucepastera parasyntrophica TaxID=2880008 RepID=UPI00210F0B3A|nr:hypothetical protein [Brucepastera parasyntrophica]ULQ59238.1 hypothetical protein K7I13_12155 [Brucepastera parasyntrophica]